MNAKNERYILYKRVEVVREGGRERGRRKDIFFSEIFIMRDEWMLTIYRK